MMRLAVALSAILLAGCSTTRFVTVPCLTPEQYEELRKSEPEKIGDKLNGKADEDIRIVAGSNIRLRSWGRGLLGVLEGCTK